MVKDNDAEKVDVESSMKRCLENRDLPFIIHTGKNTCDSGEVGHPSYFQVQESHCCQKKYDKLVSTTDLSSFTSPNTPSSTYASQCSTSQLTTPRRENDHQDISRFSLSPLSPIPSSTRDAGNIKLNEWTKRRRRKTFFIDEEALFCGGDFRPTAYNMNVDLNSCQVKKQSLEETTHSYHDFSPTSSIESYMVDSSLSSSGVSEDNNEAGINLNQLDNSQFHTLSDSSSILSNPRVILRKSSTCKEVMTEKQQPEEVKAQNHSLPAFVNFHNRVSAKSLMTTCQISIAIYSIVVLVIFSFQTYGSLQLMPTMEDTLKGTYQPLPYLKESGDKKRHHYEGYGVINSTMSLQRNIGGLHLAFHRHQEEKRFNQLRRTPGLGTLDKQLYGGSKSPFPNKVPRTMDLYYNGRRHTPLKRYIDVYPTVFSDNTQMYGFLDSGDEALAQMEKRIDLSDSQCVPIKEWQTAYHPICNALHELDLIHLGDSAGNKVDLVGKHGYWRNAWKLDLLNNDILSEKGVVDSLILKTPKYNHNFEHAHFEHDRIDAMAMERLTSSPHVINIYGFCGRSVITEFADGPRLGTLADKSKKYPLKRLAIARDIASALSDVHRIDGDERATFAHLDINPANVVVIDNTLKLNDFNIGVMIKYNTSSHSQCGFPSQYPNPQWRSPEEAAQSPQLTEKVDVFSLGHIFFRLICGHEPWNKLEKGGKPSSSELTSKVKNGKLPRIPDYVLNTKDPEIKAILEAMLACYTSDPIQRPSSREISDFLENELKKLSTSK